MTQGQKEHLKENWQRYLNTFLLTVVLAFLSAALVNEGKLGDKIDDLQNQVSKMNVQDTRITNVETDIGRHETRINTLEQNFARLDDRLNDNPNNP